MDIRPVILTGKYVRLEPLQEAHAPRLAVYGLDEEIWRWMRYGQIHKEAELLAWVQDLLDLQAQGNDLPFAVIALPVNQAVGASRYLNINRKDRSVEIGGTWYGHAFQGTAVNPESKYLLLRHAFESLGCVRVHFKTDLRNVRSQRAIEKLGAVKEGIHRNNVILPDGTIRSSVIYSILAEEWEKVKERLEERLSKY